MILPSRNIAPDRALLTIAGNVFQRLSEPMTVSRLWDDLRREYQKKPISYSWFILAIDLLYVMNLVWFDQDGLLRRSKGES
ncbi:MAG: ABC-three component system middle component 6 [Methylocystis sp.]